MKTPALFCIVASLFSLVCGQSFEDPPFSEVGFFPKLHRLNDTEWDILQRIARSEHQTRSVIRVGGRLTDFARGKNFWSYYYRFQDATWSGGPSLQDQWEQRFPGLPIRDDDLRENSYVGTDSRWFAETALLHWNIPEALARENVWGNPSGTNNTISVAVREWDLENLVAHIHSSNTDSRRDPFLLALPDGMIWQPHWNLMDVINQVSFRGLGMLEKADENTLVSPWFGSFRVLQDGWIMHDYFGLLYVAENHFGASTGYWFFQHDLGWFWTMPDLSPLVWSEKLGSKALLWDLGGALHLASLNDLCIELVAIAERNVPSAYPRPEFEVGTNPGVVLLSDDDWDAIWSLSKSSREPRKSLFLSGWLSRYTQEKTKSMVLSGKVSHDDPHGKSIRLQMDRYAPGYDGWAIQLLNSCDANDWINSLTSDWLENESAKEVLVGGKSADGEDDYSECSLLGASTQTSSFQFKAISAVYGKGSKEADPLFVFLPDGMFWFPSWNLIEFTNRSSHGGLGFLKTGESGVWNSPWFGDFSIVSGAWVQHRIFGYVYVYGNRTGESKGYKFYNQGIGWFWMTPGARRWVYLSKDSSWYQVNTDQLGYFLKNPETGDVLRLGSGELVSQ